MQKKIIALAIAGLASTAAFAQSNVTIYGRADLGAVDRGGNSGAVNGVHRKYEMASGIQGGSRIGFKGSEDLGNGLKAIFEMEYGISLDQNTGGAGSGGGAATTNTTWVNRHSYVGLTGNFGTVVGGHLDGVRYGVFNQYDPFAGGTVGNFTQMTIQVDRASNAVAYISPKFAGFGVVLAYATAIDAPESAGNGIAGNAATGDNSLQTVMGTYDNGPISARLDYEQVNPTNKEGKTQVFTAAGSYDFNVVKVSALYDQIKSNIGTAGVVLNQQAWFVGLKAPVGKFTLKAVGGQLRDRLDGHDDMNSWKLGLGTDYSLSKRTNLYATYGYIHNQKNAAIMISQAANSEQTGYGTNGFDFGIAHSF